MGDVPAGQRRCPYCAEMIRAEAKLCRFCGSMLVDEPPPRRVAPGESLVSGPAAPQAEALAKRTDFPTLTLGDRRIATVFFFDIERYTSMTQEMDPEEVQDLLNRFYEGAIAIIHKYDGSIDNIVGDEILSVFGVPAAHENDPELALRTALEMLEYVKTFNSQSGREIHIHGGVHSGMVVTGELGSTTHSHFTLVGSTVNLASRLTSAARLDEVLVSWETQEQVSEEFEFDDLGAMDLRGFGTPQRVFRLRGIRTEYRGMGSPPRRVRTPFVGREAELRQLGIFLETPGEGGRCPALWLRADMGYGKTRTVFEAVRRFAGEARFLRGVCATWARGVPLFPLVDLLRQVIRVGPLASVEEIRAKTDDLIAGLPPEHQPDVTCLRHLLGDPQAVELLRDEPVADRRLRLINAGLELIHALSRTGPLVLFLDDLQWCDTSTFEFLGEFLDREDFDNCRLILASRPTEPKINLGRAIPEIRLEPLGAEDSRTLLREIFAQLGLSTELQHLILQRGEGNPLFIEEIARMVLDEIIGKTSAELAEIQEHLVKEIPHNLHSIIQARIDRLEIKARMVLQCGAVLGREFLFDALTMIEAIKEGLLEKMITLESLQILLRRVGETFLRYYFRNSLTQEVVYTSMLKRQRRQLHEIVAGALEELFADRLREYAAQIAFHWERAENLARAAIHLTEAAQRALDLGDLRQADLHAASAIQHLSGLKPTPEIRRTMVKAMMLAGVVHRNAGEIADSLHALRLALHTARVVGEEDLIAGVLLDLGHTTQLRGRYAQAEKLIDMSLKILSRVDDRRLMALAHQRLGIIAWHRGQIDHALECCRRVEQIATTEDNPVIASDNFNNMGLILWHQGKPRESLPVLERAAELRRRCHLAIGEVATECNIGIISEQMGHFAEAEQHYRRALGRAEAQRYRLGQAAILTNIANIELLRRRWLQALELSTRAESIAHSIDDRRSEAIALENRALSELGMDERVMADRSLTRAEALATEMGDQERIASLALARASLCLARNSADQAEVCCQKARDIIHGNGLSHLEPTAIQRTAEIALVRGESSRARELLQSAINICHATDQCADEIRLLRLLVVSAGGLNIPESMRATNRDRLEKLECELMTP